MQYQYFILIYFKCDLPLCSITLQDVKVEKKKKDIVIQSPDGKYSLVCNSEEESNSWHEAICKALNHQDDQGGEELTPAQQQTLDELKNHFPDADNAILRHFLIANHWNIDQTIQLYTAHLHWKKDVRLNDLKISSVWRYLKTGRVFYTNMKDKKGRPIVVFRARLHNPSEDFMHTYLLGMYLLERAVEDAGDGQIVVINDLSGFEKQNNDFRMNKLILEMVLAHFPNRVGAIWCTSTSWLFRMVFRVIKPWLGDDLISRVHLFGGTSELKELVDKDQLLTDLGGSAKEDIEGWAKQRAEIEGVSLDEPTQHKFGNEEIVAAFSDAPVSHTADGCVRQGWLKKQGGFVKKFNKRYCVLKGTILYYYRGQNDPKADGIVFLRNSTLTADKSTTFHIITSGGKDCIFQLVDKKDTEWLKVLETVIVANGGKVGKSSGDSENADPVDSFARSWSNVKKDKKSSKDLHKDVLFSVYQEETLRRFPDGYIPKNELIEVMTSLVNDKDKVENILSIWIDNQFLFPSSPKDGLSSDAFLFTFTSLTNVLNLTCISDKSSKKSPKEIVLSLYTKLTDLIKSHTKDGKVDRKELRNSRGYFDFLIETSELQRISISGEKEDFFFNLRSLILLHAQVHCGLPRGCHSRFYLFNRAQYVVGMNHFSYSDITHGILRANSPAPESILGKHFTDKKDPRLEFSLKKGDERILFAISGITIDSFHICEDYETTLNEATKTFISKFVKIEDDEVFVPVMLAWVNSSDRLGFLRSLMNPEDQERMKQSRVVLQNVDWSTLGFGYHYDK